ncbi:DUF5362 domain-containing protein [Coralloluteibacterium stylophorae]|uniref:DUF5362 domain-containing protein n=1 Tax=Coralloluteibacterium stylophorae TaxID=1776034 RepID=A0A8J8AYC6_9GAMM|nr:DUF5362 domain-containing protein [Coralloluteibacterium stylophorae]MBS7457889.1 DUF5362 domain-containing protein [Coralloluteibacterium stylophorae]
MTDPITAPPAPPAAPLPPAAHTTTAGDLARPLASARGWMKLVGIVSIIQGALTALTIIGIVVAWLPIWIGVLVLQAAGAIERAERDNDGAALAEALARLKTYFVIQGVLLLLWIVFTVLVMLAYGGIIIAAVASGGLN